MLEDFVTVSEAAALRKASPETIRRWCRDGWLKGARHVGARSWLVPRAELMKFEPPNPGPRPSPPAAEE